MPNPPIELEKLSKTKRMLLEKLRSGEHHDLLGTDVIQPRRSNGFAPLSPSQERLWFLNQFESNKSYYNICNSLHLKGPLEFDLLKKAFAELLKRHESLRTSIRVREKKPVQCISSDNQLPLDLVDLSDLGSAEQPNLLAEGMAEACAQPFHLDQGALIRPVLFCLGEHENVLLIIMHHIISDGRSCLVLFKELGMIYTCLVEKRPSVLTRPKLQFRDFSEWQAEPAQLESIRTHLGYWRQNLNGAPTFLNLPTDKCRPAEPSGMGGKEQLRLSPFLSHQFKTLARNSNTSLFVALLSAFQVLLSKYASSYDFLIGTPSAGRKRTELEDLIGCFTNTLVLRASLSENPTFLQLLEEQFSCSPPLSCWLASSNIAIA